VHIRLRTPDLTEELVRFLRRMGFRAREIDYGVVAVEPNDDRRDSHLDAYLRIWQQVHVRGALELDPAPVRAA
jgi:hypothetical protein